jgi:hypothetical protein
VSFLALHNYPVTLAVILCRVQLVSKLLLRFIELVRDVAEDAF